jgi:carbon storage regulator
MLTLSRKADDAILIGTDIRIVIKRIDGDIVKIGIEAPKHVPIYREEVFSKISEQNLEALKRAQSASVAGQEFELKWPEPPARSQARIEIP